MTFVPSKRVLKAFHSEETKLSHTSFSPEAGEVVEVEYAQTFIAVSLPLMSEKTRQMLLSQWKEEQAST